MNREAKIEKLAGLLTLWLNDSPFKIDGVFSSPLTMAERIVKEMENE